VHRDGTNEYFINGSLVRLRDILELLSNANIGSTGHHIISQGEADRILSVSPKERKAIIEDALGLKIYQYKKEESQRKLEKTEENIKQVESLRREIAPHLKFLGKQVEKLERLESMKEELIAFYTEYFKRESVYLKQAKQKTAREIEAPQKELAELEIGLNNAKSLLQKEDRSERIDELSEHERTLEERRWAVSNLSKDIGRLEGEISSVEKNLKRQRDFLEREKAVSVPLADVKQLSTEIEDISAQAGRATDVGVFRKIIEDIKNSVLSFVRRASGTNVEENELVVSGEKELKELQTQKNKFEKDFEDAQALLREAQEAYLQKRAEVEKEKDTYKDAEKEIYKIMARQNELRGILNALLIVEQKITLESQEYERELNEAFAIVGPRAIHFDEVAIVVDGREIGESDILAEERKFQEDRKKAIEKIKIRLEDQGLAGADELMKEFRETTERDTFLERELNDLELSATSLSELIKELERKLAIEFETGVHKINTEFSKFFGLMFGGGEAGLKLTRQQKRKRKDTDLEFDIDAEEIEGEEDVEEGIEVAINLPHKKIKSLMMLSGGERALSSIALLFAISQVNPPPFVVLDETDAALDEANSRKYADMVRSLSKHSQIILITHNRETMNSAGILYGITMGSDGVSKLLSVSFDEATNYAK
jgi:chromosome segregation protein